MNKTRVFALFLSALALLIAFKQFTSSNIPAKELKKEAVILAFGDSLTFGTGANVDESYPKQLEKKIGRTVINAGVPGELSEEGLRRLDPLLNTHKPALLLLCHGGNDILKKNDPERLRSNLESMVKLARERHIDVIVIAVPQFSLLHLSAHPLYEEIADRYTLPIENDILADILGDNRYKSDYIHPNRLGYEQLAEALEKVIREEYHLKE